MNDYFQLCGYRGVDSSLTNSDYPQECNISVVFLLFFCRYVASALMEFSFSTSSEQSMIDGMVWRKISVDYCLKYCEFIVIKVFNYLRVDRCTMLLQASTRGGSGCIPTMVFSSPKQPDSLVGIVYTTRYIILRTIHEDTGVEPRI